MENTASYLLASTYSGVAPIIQVPFIQGLFGIFGLVWLVLVVLIIVSNWKIFTKAGQPGWASIIPIYNILILLRIVGRPWWWIFLFFIPWVNIVFGIIVAYDLAKRFGKGVGFTVGLILLPIVFYPILAFGKAVYSASPISPATPAPMAPTPSVNS